MTIKTPVRSLFLLFALLALWGCATLPEHYVSVETGQHLSLSEMLHRTENRRVVFVGERHTSGRDHLVQLEVIRYLHEKGEKGGRSP